MTESIRSDERQLVKKLENDIIDAAEKIEITEDLLQAIDDAVDNFSTANSKQFEPIFILYVKVVLKHLDLFPNFPHIFGKTTRMLCKICSKGVAHARFLSKLMKLWYECLAKTDKSIIYSIFINISVTANHFQNFARTLATMIPVSIQLKILDILYIYLKSSPKPKREMAKLMTIDREKCMRDFTEATDFKSIVQKQLLLYQFNRRLDVPHVHSELIEKMIFKQKSINFENDDGFIHLNAATKTFEFFVSNNGITTIVTIRAKNMQKLKVLTKGGFIVNRLIFMLNSTVELEKYSGEIIDKSDLQSKTVEVHFSLGCGKQFLNQLKEFPGQNKIEYVEEEERNHIFDDSDDCKIVSVQRIPIKNDDSSNKMYSPIKVDLLSKSNSPAKEYGPAENNMLGDIEYAENEDEYQLRTFSPVKNYSTPTKRTPDMKTEQKVIESGVDEPRIKSRRLSDDIKPSQKSSKAKNDKSTSRRGDRHLESPKESIDLTNNDVVSMEIEKEIVTDFTQKHDSKQTKTSKAKTAAPKAKEIKAPAKAKEIKAPAKRTSRAAAVVASKKLKESSSFVDKIYDFPAETKTKRRRTTAPKKTKITWPDIPKELDKKPKPSTNVPRKLYNPNNYDYDDIDGVEMQQPAKKPKMEPSAIEDITTSSFRADEIDKIYAQKRILDNMKRINESAKTNLNKNVSFSYRQATKMKTAKKSVPDSTVAIELNQSLVINISDEEEIDVNHNSTDKICLNKNDVQIISKSLTMITKCVKHIQTTLKTGVTCVCDTKKALK